MKLSEKLILLPACAGVIAMLSACACWQPIDEKCAIPSHKVNTAIAPDAVAFNQVTILPCMEAYRPSFTVGAKRVQAVGNGMCAKAALQDAVAKICIENDCDMVSAAKAIIVRTSHPRWIFFHYNTYQVKLSGLPLTMTSMVKEKVLPPPPPRPCPVMTKEDIKAIFVEMIKAMPQPKPACKPALIHLKDIRLNMTAGADTDSPIAVKVPPCIGK